MSNDLAGLLRKLSRETPADIDLLGLRARASRRRRTPLVAMAMGAIAVTLLAVGLTVDTRSVVLAPATVEASSPPSTSPPAFATAPDRCEPEGCSSCNAATTDSSSATVRWCVDVRGSRGGAAVSPRRVAVTTDRALLALDVATGEPAWQQAVTYPLFASPVHAGDMFVVSDPGADSLASFDELTGALLWAIGGPRDLSADDTAVSTAGNTLSVAEGGLYTGTTSRDLVAYELRTGDERWRIASAGNPDVPPQVASGFVYAVIGARITALDPNTGATMWHNDTLSVIADRIAVVAGVVVAFDPGGIPFALDAATGALLWNGPADGAVGALADVVGGEQEAIVVDHSGAITAWAATSGDRLWDAIVDTGDSPTAAVSGDRLYVGAGHHVNVLNRRTGATIERITFEGEVYAMSTSPDALYVTTASGLFAIDLTD